MSNPQYLEIHLKASKTDPFRQGVSVVVGKTDNVRCPVAAGLAYMVTRGSSPGIFFCFSDGKGLTRDRFVKVVRLALSSAGVDASHYSCHSFQIGAATAASLCDISEVLIKTMGRWESLAYVHAVRSYPSGTVVCSGSEFRSIVNLLGCICLLVLNECYSIGINCQLMAEVHGIQTW